MTLFETKEWLHDLWNLLVDVNICRINSTRIIQNVYQNEDAIKNGGFFNHYLFQLKFILAIQLCKILDDNKNQERNIMKFMRRLESETWDKDLMDAVSSNAFVDNPGRHTVVKELQFIKSSIESQKELIQSIVRVRNQNYAHSDTARDKTGPSVKRYEEAVVFASEMYNKISYVLFGNTSEFNHMDDWEIDPILKSLSKEWTDWLKDHEIKFGA